MTQKQARKILRIGIIQGGKIIEERLLRKREPVTVGEATKNTFVIPATGLPSRFPLFELKGDKYYLTVADWMEGRLSLGTGVADLNGLKKQGIAKKVGQVDYKAPKTQSAKKKVFVFQIPLSEKSRGKLTFGEITLLFQFVTPPPLPQKPQLPGIIQGGWIKGIDWFFSTIMLVSFILHSGLVYWCQITGPLPKTTLDQVPERFAKYMSPPRTPPPPPPREVKKGKEKKGDKKGKKAKKKAAPKKRPKARKRVQRPAKRRAAPSKRRRAPSASELKKARETRRQEVRKKVGRAGILALLGAKGTGGGPSVKDMIAGGGIDTKLSRALKGVSGVSVGGRRRGPRGSRRGGGKRGSINLRGRALAAGPSGGGGGGKAASGGKRKRAKISSSLKIRRIEPEGGTLNQSKLGRLLRRKRSVFQYCYEKELKRSPSLRGKISIRVQIAMNGRVAGTEIETNRLGSSVARCIVSKIRRIRFPKPEGEPVSIVIPLIFSPSS